MTRVVIQTLALSLLFGCTEKQSVHETLFSDVTSTTGIDFANNLSITERINPYTYRNFYNGAGVAIGDINNDGLQDIYFTGNQVGNKLYLNKGNFKFQDITETAGVACHGVWSTGITMVDINGDGLLDLYVCKSGDPETPHRNNELFVNNGDLTFTARSKEYGLNVTGLSVQAAFFDYDKDGDLDCYLLTNSFKSVGNFDLVKDQRNIPDPQGGGNRFLINQNGKFVDYSAKSGIFRSNIGFGLGITLGDFNNDSWTDIFVSNDFFERDYLYINNQQGGFVESLPSYFQSISMGSMGADFADLDNDGQPELFVTEMLPDSLSRKKTKTIFENWNKYEMNVQNGYYHQFSRNVLQKKLNKECYGEIGRMAGVAASEWSWGALLFDMDNDGKRDIFIANGIYKDLLDRDYLTFTASEDNVRELIRKEKNAILKLIDLMPSSPVSNYAFRNEGELHFKNNALEWGLGKPMFSCGSAYGDLDNDGDMDLVISNINAPSVVYRNNSDSSRYKSIDLLLSGEKQNSLAVGAQVVAYCDGRTYSSDNFVTRGFMSSTQPRIHLGLGEGVKRIDSLKIQWPDDRYSNLSNVAVNQLLEVSESSAKGKQPKPPEKTPDVILDAVRNNLFRHEASGLNDFNRERLLPMMCSNETPSILKGDIDKDGVDDFYLGGGRNQSSKLISFNEGKFTTKSLPIFEKNKLPEETKGSFIDVDSDGDLDLYIATGGRFFPKVSSALEDKILINDGKGNFMESKYRLPFGEFFSTSVAKAIDFDKDGDADLFVGDRGDSFTYGAGGRGYFLENDGRGLFTDVTEKVAPSLMRAGMITDAEVADINLDGFDDIVIVGDWMAVTVLQNDKGHFADVSKKLGLSESAGWWHNIVAADLNQDGKMDFVLGNHGLNTFFKVGDRMYLNDFDRNGVAEQLFCTRDNGRYYPIVEKDELVSQLPSLRKSILFYKDYSKKAIDDLFPESILEKSKIFEVQVLASMLLLSNGNGYDKVELPQEAQYSTIYACAIFDWDGDGILDLVAGGNQYQVKPQFGRYDASNGWLFKGKLKNGKFSFHKGKDLSVKGQIRDINYFEAAGTKFVLFAKHDDELEIYKIGK